MQLEVDDNNDDLRFELEAATLYRRPIYLTIDGKLAMLEVESFSEMAGSNDSEDVIDLTDPNVGLGRTVVRFTYPNEFDIRELEIPRDSEAKAQVSLPD